MKIKFLNSDKQFETDLPEVTLLEVCRKVRAPINFGCRIGICGTCKVTLTGDLNNVSKKNQPELDFTSEPNERLACQCMIKGDIYVEQPKGPDQGSSVAANRKAL